MSSTTTSTTSATSAIPAVPAPFALTAKDMRVLSLVHPSLEKIVVRAATETEMPFMVLEGVRTLSRQKKLKKSGASKTLNSRHLSGHAVDLVPLIDGKPKWDVPATMIVAAAMFKAADDLGFTGKMRWGGDWDEDGDYYDSRFYDGPHFELKSQFYSSKNPAKRTKKYLDSRVNGTPTNQLRTKIDKFDGQHKTAFASEVQMALGNMGIKDDGKLIEVDGYYGEATREGVALAQALMGVTPKDGLWGPATGTAYRAWAKAVETKRAEIRAKAKAQAEADAKAKAKADAEAAAKAKVEAQNKARAQALKGRGEGVVSDDKSTRPVQMRTEAIDKAAAQEKARNVLPKPPAHKQGGTHTGDKSEGGGLAQWGMLFLFVVGLLLLAYFAVKA